MRTVAVLAGLFLAVGLTAAGAQTGGSNAVLVSADNFVRAETDRYFGAVVMDGGFGKFFHRYRPRVEILSGKWRFPEARPAS